VAYSQDIVQLIADAVAAITTSSTLPATPAFHTREMWSFSQLDDAVYPLVILDRPLNEDGKQMIGAGKKSYQLTLYIFAGTLEPNADFTLKEALLILSEEIKTGLLLKLSGCATNLGRLEDITGYKSTEIPETRQVGSNPCGLMLQIPVTYISYAAIC
jgi:hypothetical protein